VSSWERKTGANWSAQANNPYYRVGVLIVPAATSTGLLQLEFKATFLPHVAGRILLKRRGQEQEIKIIAGQKIEFEDGGDCEILNLSDRELGFTVMEFK
jgi:hypothetical protein